VTTAPARQECPACHGLAATGHATCTTCYGHLHHAGRTIVRGLAFVPTQDTPGKRDCTGAFLPEARLFTRLHSMSPPACFPNAEGVGFRARGEAVLAALAQRRDLDVVAFFCHGWRDGLQCGFRLGTIDRLADALAVAGTRQLVVALYACDAARDADDARADDTGAAGPGGDGGFADELRDALCRRGLVDCRVDAHVTTAHTTRNPYVRRFEGGGSVTGGQGGAWLVRPGSRLWRPWVEALRAPSTRPLRLRFPLMSAAEIHAELTPAFVA
jgi:hypothetical protein